MRKRTKTSCIACEYSIDVRNKRFGLPYRQYIWAGESDDQGNLLWCFAYGEKEWVDGKSWETAEQQARDKDKYGRPQTPIGRANCK